MLEDLIDLEEHKLHWIPIGSGTSFLFSFLFLVDLPQIEIAGMNLSALLSFGLIILPGIMYGHHKVNGTRARESRKTCFTGGFGVLFSIFLYLSSQEGFFAFIGNLIN